MMCRVLKVSLSGYHAWANRPRETEATRSDRILLEHIRSIHRESRCTYGSPRIHAELRQKETRVGRKRVARLMRKDCLAGKVRRRFVITTDSSHGLTAAPSILNRDFSPKEPD